MGEAKHVLAEAELKRVIEIASKATEVKLYIPPTKYFLAETEEMAKKLLGSYLLRVEGSGEKLSVYGGRIVEAEAYLDKTDPASHAATAKITKRNKIFYETGGVAYVFHARSVYYCFNVIVRPQGLAGCVLIRALEPIFGIDVMAKRRAKFSEQLLDLCSGPGKICQALGINHLHTGADLRRSELLILNPKRKKVKTIASGPRVGITKAADWELRFWEEGSEFISK